MRIMINTEKARSAGLELLDLSRRIRRVEEETAQIRRDLQALSGLEGCCRALVRQEDASAELAGKLVRLSSALVEIAERYRRTETTNQDTLEEESTLFRQTIGGTLYTGSETTRNRLERILHA